MNIGRLVPQVVYYVYAYAQLVKSGDIQNGDKVNFTVPTGNFGNIWRVLCETNWSSSQQTYLCL